VAGPECYPLDGELLRLLADGGMITPPYENPQVLAAILAAGEAVPGVAKVRAEPGVRAEIAVRFLPEEGADEAATVQALAAELGIRVGGLLSGAVEIGVVTTPATAPEGAAPAATPPPAPSSNGTRPHGTPPA
jgi:hypothetical protein